MKFPLRGGGGGGGGISIVIYTVMCPIYYYGNSPLSAIFNVKFPLRGGGGGGGGGYFHSNIYSGLVSYLFSTLTQRACSGDDGVGVGAF